MPTASDTLSAFFVGLQQGRWTDASALLHPGHLATWRNRAVASALAMRQLMSQHAPQAVLRMSQPEDAAGPSPALVAQLANQPVPPGLGVATVGELCALEPRVLVERVFASQTDLEGRFVLPWGARRVAVLDEQSLGPDHAEVRYAYVDQPEDELPDDVRRSFQRPWRLRAERDGEGWLLDVPQGTLLPIQL